MPPAGKVAIQFEINSNSFSSGMEKITKQVRQFQGATSDASHSSVSNINQISGSLRLLENVQATNLRALERWVSQSKIASQVFAAAFPLVGAIAAVGMVTRLGTEIATAVKKLQEMPKAINQGFNSMHLATASATDGLRLTNDELQRSIDRLSGKSDTKNLLAIRLDQARIKADELGKSLAADAEKVKELLDKNKLGSWSVFMGKGDTNEVSGSVNSFESQFKDLGFRAQDARRQGNTGLADDLDKQLRDKQNAATQWATNQLGFYQGPFAHGDQSANVNILQGFRGDVYDRMGAQSEQDRNGDLVGQQKAAQDAHAAAEKAAEARRKEAEEMRKSWEHDARMWENAQAVAENIAKIVSEYSNEFSKTQGLSSADSDSLTQSGKSANSYIQSLRASIDLAKQNSTAISESSISMAVMTGQMTRQDAATALLALHTQEYSDALKQLQEQREGISQDSHISDLEKQARLQDNSNRTSDLNANWVMQQAQDNQNANPASSSAIVGFKDAINDFVNSTKDSAQMMKSITEGTLKSLNDTVLSKNPDFKSFGAGVFHNVASAGLNKAEGSLLGSFGIKDPNAKLGTQSNPMYTRNADAVSSGVGSIGKLFSSSDDGDGSGGFMSMLKHVPFLATGGPIDGPSIVGEQGPELFVPHSSGSIIPNHKLKSSGGSHGEQHIHIAGIDARGAHDPAAVEAAVHRGIVQAAPHIMAGAVSLGRNMQNRRPTSSR